MVHTTISDQSHKFCRKNKLENGGKHGPWIYQRWDQVSRRSKYPYKHGPWIYQRWDQVSRRSKHPYKHGPLDIPEVESGV
jgi:hypothetical protein